MSVDDAKDFALENLKYPDYALDPLIEKADRGFVTWDAAQPAGVNYQTHKFSFVDAMMTALRFCETDCIDDWGVLGPQALAVIRTLPHFVEKPERHGGKFTFVGTWGAIRLYANPRAEADAFWFGHGTMCCPGRIVNGV